MRRLLRVAHGGRALGGAMLLALLVFRVWDPALLMIVRDRTFDLYQLVLPRQAPDTPVIVVDLDERSLAEFGQWPWPRTLIADLLAALFNGGAAVVGFDVLFAEPDRLSPELLADQLLGLDEDTRTELRGLPNNDAVLADVLRQTRVVVGRAVVAEPRIADTEPAEGPAVAMIGEDPAPYLLHSAGLLRNVPVLEAAAAGHGLLSLAPELDGIVRRVPAIMLVKGRIYPTLVVELLRVAAGQSAIAVRANEAGIDSVVVAGIRIPTDERGRIWVHYAKRSSGRVVSAVDVLRRTLAPGLLANKLVLIGTSAVGLQDIKTTPLESGVPGVEVHAQILDMILTNSFLIRPNFALAVELAAALAVGLVVIWLVPAVGAVWTLLVGGVTAAVLMVGSWALYATSGLLIDATYPSVAALLVFAMLSYLSYVREEVARRQVRTAFSQYMSPALVAELAEDPARLKLGGETKQMTFLFCDVRGFTAISEAYKTDPQGLTTLINDLLTPLTEAVLGHRGTIDKYMGDCVMAFWNAPLDDPEHALNACRAALAMTAAVDRLNAERRTGSAEGGSAGAVQVGIGINTGDCVVGNMGSRQRFDYSVLGDAVNLASRLEAQSKTYGVDIIVGANTAALVRDRLALLEIDVIAVKGKREAVRIFALIGNGEVLADRSFQALHDSNAAMLAAYRARDWDGAAALIGECRSARRAPPALYDLYEARVARYRANPPLPDWDGVFAAEAK